MAVFSDMQKNTGLQTEDKIYAALGLLTSQLTGWPQLGRWLMLASLPIHAINVRSAKLASQLMSRHSGVF